MRITFIANYVPQRCGIATYTRDLVKPLRKSKIQIEVVIPHRWSDKIVYPKIVKRKIKKNSRFAYQKVARDIEKNNTDIVSLQHEYGIFGGRDGEYILEVTKNIHKPLITTLHTVLSTPTSNQKRILEEIARNSKKVIVMGKTVLDRLEQIYHVARDKIVVIPHGVPNINSNYTSRIPKIQKRIEEKAQNKCTLLSINLLSENKGIEYAIQALPKVIQKTSDIHYFIVGVTHPEVKKRKGETYRKFLQELVKRLNLQDYVTFINEYISLAQLKRLLKYCDIYITPYLNPEQITSGNLAYAIGAGKACISTPYIYAQELLGSNRGVLVNFRDSDSIAESIIDLYQHPEKRKILGERARLYSAKMQWPEVAKKYLKVFQDVCKI